MLKRQERLIVENRRHVDATMPERFLAEWTDEPRSGEEIWKRRMGDGVAE